MRRTTRLLAGVWLAAGLAACSDSPTQAPQGSEDPAIARANVLLAGHGRIIASKSWTEIVRLPTSAPGTAAAGAAIPEEVRAQFNIPFYCDAGNTHPYCPQIIVGAAVWNNGNNNGTRAINLYAHLDAMLNVQSSELDVSYAVVGGCSGSPGTYASDTVYGGSNASAGGPYGITANRNETFSGGSSKWSVYASGQATGVYGNFTGDSASDTECIA